MTGENRPWSEVFKEAADDWVDKEDAAHILEETKTLVMSQKQAMLGDIPVNRAEQTVKASKEWYDHVLKICEARRVANKAWVEVEWAKMKSNEWNNAEANHRVEARL